MIYVNTDFAHSFINVRNFWQIIIIYIYIYIYIYMYTPSTMLLFTFFQNPHYSYFQEQLTPSTSICTFPCFFVIYKKKPWLNPRPSCNMYKENDTAAYISIWLLRWAGHVIRLEEQDPAKRIPVARAKERWHRDSYLMKEENIHL